MIRYPAVLDGKKGAYGLVIPDIPGAYAMGATVEEVLADAEDMLPEFVEALKARNGSIAPPRDIENVTLEPGETVVYVTLREPDTSIGKTQPSHRQQQSP